MYIYFVSLLGFSQLIVIFVLYNDEEKDDDDYVMLLYYLFWELLYIYARILIYVCNDVARSRLLCNLSLSLSKTEAQVAYRIV